MKRTLFHALAAIAVSVAAAAFVVAFIFMSGAVAVSASALPSEPLYGVKRAVEDARLLVAAGSEKEQLAASFGQRRRDEILEPYFQAAAEQFVALAARLRTRADACARPPLAPRDQPGVRVRRSWNERRPATPR